MSHTIKLELSLYQAQVLSEFVKHLIVDMPDVQTADEEEPYNPSVMNTLGAITLKIDEALEESVNAHVSDSGKTKKKKTR